MNYIAVLVGFFLSISFATGVGDRKNQLERAINRGLDYLAAAWDGQEYADPYLQYVYPGENLPSPVSGWKITYRRIDAYFNLLLISGVLEDSGPLRPHVRAATRLLKNLPRAWRGVGIHNVMHDGDPAGVGLDTYCIVGLAEHDRDMARQTLRHMDGFDWIPEGYYKDFERFRKFADETWCIRLLMKTNVAPEVTSRLFMANLQRAEDQMGRAKQHEERAYLALHALYMLLDAGHAAPDEQTRRFLEAAMGIAEEPSIQKNLLLQANLLDVMLQAETPDARAPIARITHRLLEAQGDDGGWPSIGGESGSRARSFTTLRVLLALGRLQSSREH
jgi:hypothetical protein